MRVVLALIKKEFLQIFRNKIMVRLVLIMPIMQLILLVYAANFEMKNMSLSIVDRDGSPISRQITNQMQASGYFILTNHTTNITDALKYMERDKADVIIEIPANFESSVYRGESPSLAVTLNAINGMKAGVAASYIGTILAGVNVEVATLLRGGFEANLASTEAPTSSSTAGKFDVTYSNWFNPKLDYKSLMLPGILCILLTLIGILIAALNIVHEKETGTIEQLNVTPINKFQFIIGKLVPYGMIAMVQLSLGLAVSVLLFGLVIEGNLFLVYLVVAVYMMAVLGIGFLISTVSQTQSQAMFVTLFFMFIFILLSGLFTPIESMPVWAQYIDLLNPTAYLVSMVRLIILKGSTFADIQQDFFTVVAFAVVINLIVVWRYKKVS